MVDEIKDFSMHSDSILTIGDLRLCTKKANEILNYPEVCLAIDSISKEVLLIDERLVRIESAIVRDFIEVEQALLQIFDTHATRGWFEFSREQGLFIGKKIVLTAAFQYLTIGEELNRHNSCSLGIRLLSEDLYIEKRKKEIAEETERYFQSLPNMIAWQKQKTQRNELSTLQDDIRFIRKFNCGLGKKCDVVRLKSAIQRFGIHLVTRVLIVKTLSNMNMNTITFNYTSGSKPEEAQLTVYANNDYPVKSQGVTAFNFYQLLNNPFKGTVFSEDSRENDKIRKDFKRLNIRIAQKWSRFGFAIGQQELIYPDGYSYRITTGFCHLVRKR